MHHPREVKPEGAPEWMVSYADMITIVMSFFVVMFSIASGEAAKGRRTQQQEEAIESLQYRFGPKWKPFTSWNIMPGNSTLPGGGRGLGSTDPVPAVGDPGGTVPVNKTKQKSRIRVRGKGDLVAIGGWVYFDQATTDLVRAADQTNAIKNIAEELAGKPQEVEIVATASSRPLPRKSSFRDRWELGYARCRQTAELFTALKIDSERLRLSVVPAKADDGKGDASSEADTAVRVYLSTTLPGGAEVTEK